MTDQPYYKISFPLEQDENGYPPTPWESLWAYKEGELYCIDNIPFYIKGISAGDRIRVEMNEDQLVFEELVKPSLSSVFRFYIFDPSSVQTLRDDLRTLGCQSELSGNPKLIAVEIPGNVQFQPILQLMDEGFEKGRWEYEEGVLRHQLPGMLDPLMSTK